MTSRSNWFDHLRLLFAGLVIFGHAFELPFGDRRLEPLTLVFHTLSCGELAVAGFLILSGYLITGAWDRRRSAAEYLRNRVLRIVPAFVVAFVASVLAAVAAGGSADWRRLPFDLLTLNQPSARFPTAFAWQANGALWTIQLEFGCYLLAPLMTRKAIPWLWVATALVMVLTGSWYARGLLMFLGGASYRRFGGGASRGSMIACAALLLITLHIPVAWQIGLATAGALLLLDFAERPAPFRLGADLSYGLYLYGWPVQKVLILAGLSSPWALFPLSLFVSMGLGALSWFAIERSALRMKERQQTTNHALSVAS